VEGGILRCRLNLKVSNVTVIDEEPSAALNEAKYQRKEHASDDRLCNPCDQRKIKRHASTSPLANMGVPRRIFVRMIAAITLQLVQHL
jgi:hypothetical protein